jgi:hypothetical protein
MKEQISLKVLEGKIISAEIANLFRQIGNPKRKIPYISVLIEENSGERKNVIMPIDIGENFLEIQKSMIGSKVVYEKESERDYENRELHFTKKLTLSSGIKYEWSEKI